MQSSLLLLFCFYRKDIQGLQKCVNVEQHLQRSKHTLFPPVRLCPGSLSAPVPLLCLFPHPRLKVHLLQKQLLDQLSAHKAKSPSWFSGQHSIFQDLIIFPGNIVMASRCLLEYQLYSISSLCGIKAVLAFIILSPKDTQSYPGERISSK